MAGRLYLAKVRRDGDHWALNVYGLNGATAPLFTFDRLDEVVRDLIALVLNVPTDSFDVAIEISDTADQSESF